MYEVNCIASNAEDYLFYVQHTNGSLYRAHMPEGSTALVTQGDPVCQSATWIAAVDGRVLVCGNGELVLFTYPLSS